MLNGKWRGQELGSGTGVWSMSEQVRAGTLKLQDFFDAESCMHRSHGHCMTMGTASTMASMVEALGIGLPGNAAYPAVDGRRNVLARMAGRRIVDMVHEDQKLVEDPHARGVRERDPHAGRDRRLDQRGDPPDRHRRAHRREARHRRLRPAGQRAAVPGEPAALGQAPDGGLLLRRRPAGGDEGDLARCCTSTRVTANGKTRGREHRRRRELQPRGHQAVRRAVQGQGRHRRAARQPGAARRRSSSRARRRRR